VGFFGATEDCHAELNETQSLSLMDSMNATPLARSPLTIPVPNS